MNKTSEMLDKSLEKSRKIGKSSQKPPENDNFGVQTTAFWGTGLKDMDLDLDHFLKREQLTTGDFTDTV